jgi:hypothetical protein
MTTIDQIIVDLKNRGVIIGEAYVKEHGENNGNIWIEFENDAQITIIDLPKPKSIMMPEAEVRGWKDRRLKEKANLVQIAGEMAVNGYSSTASEQGVSSYYNTPEKIKETVKKLDADLMIYDQILREGFFAPLKSDK